MNYYPGTILKVWCPSKFVYHYGIATNDGFVIDRAPKKGIAIRTKQEFSEGEKIEIVPRENDDFSLEMIHSRAMNAIGNRSYSLLHANCEQFVNWCRKNKHISMQLTKVFGILAGLALLLIAVISSSKKKQNH